MNKTNNMRIIGRKYTTKVSIIKYEMQMSLELGCVLNQRNQIPSFFWVNCWAT